MSGATHPNSKIQRIKFALSRQKVRHNSRGTLATFTSSYGVFAEDNRTDVVRRAAESDLFLSIMGLGPSGVCNVQKGGLAKG